MSKLSRPELVESLDEMHKVMDRIIRALELVESTEGPDLSEAEFRAILDAEFTATDLALKLKFAQESLVYEYMGECESGS